METVPTYGGTLSNIPEQLTRAIEMLNTQIAAFSRLDYELENKEIFLNVEVLNIGQASRSAFIDIVLYKDVDPFLPLLRSLILSRRNEMIAKRVATEELLGAYRRQLAALGQGEIKGE